MTQREKLLRRMKQNPGGVRFTELDALLKYEGFVLFNRRGSHCTYHHKDNRVLTVVRPHGGRKTCHPADVCRVLEVLQL